MLPTEEIEQYGGKGAILNHIRDELPDVPIPHYIVKQQGQWLWSIRKELRELQRPLIVRSSSPHEYGDFEGIFESVAGIEDKYSLERAIEKVERSATSERARTYAQQNDFDISRRIHTIIQEQHEAEYQGVMMRHPNNPYLIFINCYNGSEDNRNHRTFVFDTKKRKEYAMLRYVYDDLSLDDACFLADVYEKIESLTDIAEGHSFFVEFGLHPFALYQVRPFKEIKTADFEVPEVSEEDELTVHTDLTFGITPEDGLVLPVLRTFGYKEAIALMSTIRNSVMSGKPSLGGIAPCELDQSLINYIFDTAAFGHGKPFVDELIGRLKSHNKYLDETLGDYCLLSTGIDRERYEVDLTVPNMKAMVVDGLERFLTHDVMRLLKRADVAVEAGFIYGSDFFNQTKSGDKVRIIGNGKEAIVMRE